MIFFPFVDEEEVDDETKTDSGFESRSEVEVSFGPIYLEDDPLPGINKYLEGISQLYF